MAATTIPLTSCGFCGAFGGDPCREFGVRLETPHAERRPASLFILELDGRTFATAEDAWYSQEPTDGPIWSNCGGWIA